MKFFLILGATVIGVIIFYGQTMGRTDFYKNDTNFYKEDTDNYKGNDAEMDDNTIKVFDHKENILRAMDIEEYLVGVLAAEMPSFFQMEALKSQAIAARTYAYGRIKKIYGTGHSEFLSNADVCTDHTHCQAWIDKKDYMEDKEANQGEINWKKFQDAVYQTRGLIIIYEDVVINPLFHSNSSGYTEAAQNLWSRTRVPYLQSVVSIGDDLGYNYRSTTEISVEEFFEKLGIHAKKIDGKMALKEISYERTETGRVDKIKIFGVTFTGPEIRKLFDLSSTNFTIDFIDSKFLIQTKGYGHGVGMSQWGANYMAINSNNYKEILKHYYTGVEIKMAY